MKLWQRPIRVFRTLVLCAVGLVLVGCSAFHSEELARYRREIREASELEQRSAAYAHFSAGIVHSLSGENSAAADEFYLAARLQPTDAELLSDVSGRLVESRQYEKAVDVLKLATALPDADGMLFVRLGYVYSQLGQNRKALEAHQQAVQRMPDFLPARHNLYLSLVAMGKADEAWRVLLAAKGKADSDSVYLINLAELFSDFGRRFPSRQAAAKAESIELLNQARPITTGPLELKLADDMNLLGRTESAAEIYLKFLGSDGITPALREVLRAKLADIYLRQSDRAQAIQQLTAITQENPTNAGAYYFLGAIAFEEKRWDDAILSYEKVVALQPRFEPARLDLVLARLGAGQLVEAETDLGELRKSVGETFVTEYLTGMICHERKEEAEAAQHLTTAEQLALAQDTNRLTSGFYFQLGMVHERAGAREKAVNYFEKSIALDARNADALNYLGYMWAERGENLPRARELIERALELEPDSEAILDSMGWVLYQQQDYPGAVEYLQQAISKSPKPDATIYDHLGDAHAALKEFDPAREAWEESVRLDPDPRVQEKLDRLPDGSNSP